MITGLVIVDVTQGTGRFNLAQGMFGTVMGVGASLSPTQKEAEPAQGKQAPLRRCSGFPFEQRLNDTHRRSCPVSGQSRATPTEQVLLERVTAIISSFSSHCHMSPPRLILRREVNTGRRFSAIAGKLNSAQHSILRKRISEARSARQSNVVDGSGRQLRVAGGTAPLGRALWFQTGNSLLSFFVAAVFCSFT